MVAGHELSSDKRQWDLKLRDGPKFQDGTAVLACDCFKPLRGEAA
jgi:hypothetical protein